MTPAEIRTFLDGLPKGATPGPWVGYVSDPAEKADVRPLSGCSVDSNAPDGLLIRSGRSVDDDGRVYDRTVSDDVRLTADAALIAAAPDLLAACEDAFGTVTHGVPDDDRAKWPVRQTLAKLRAAIAKARGTT